MCADINANSIPMHARGPHPISQVHLQIGGKIYKYELKLIELTGQVNMQYQLSVTGSHSLLRYELIRL